MKGMEARPGRRAVEPPGPHAWCGVSPWLAAVVLAATSSFAAGVAAQEVAPAPHPWEAGDPIQSLRKAYQGQLRIGAAIDAGMVGDGASSEFLQRQFDVIVPENELKPLTLGLREGQYDFAAADAIIDWARKHRIKVRGNCLIWHEQEIPWMFTQDGQPVSRDLLIRRMRAYIHDVVRHFKGRIWAWDVVNEAFTAGEPGAESTGGWRRSGWYDIIGPDYVRLAFQFAREADPGALLFYNDYETQNPARRAMILELVRSLRKGGVAIDGIGHQSHYSVGRSVAAELEATIRGVARLGLRNHVTELDISLRESPGSPVPVVTPELQALQASRWTELFEMFRRNARTIDAVVLWGVNDETSWLQPPDEPLLFSTFRPKPAFWAVLDEARRKID